MHETEGDREGSFYFTDEGDRKGGDGLAVGSWELGAR